MRARSKMAKLEVVPNRSDIVKTAEDRTGHTRKFVITQDHLIKRYITSYR